MLKIEHFIKNYGDFHMDCSMEVLPGRVTGLIGANGAGKTTIFKAALGLISPDGGKIRILGKDSRELTKEDKRKIGVVLADSGFSGYLTIRDILPVLGSMYPKFDRAAFLGLCRRFGLPEKKQIRQFSTGMKVKLKVISAVTHDASLLVLDEPTAGLDVIAREELLELIREFMEKKEENSVLISSHISSDLEGLCDDLYMIHKGRIILHEDTDVLLSEYALLKVDEEQFQKLDRQYLLSVKKESYGYACLTAQKQFYLENYPGIVVEKGAIDELIVMMERGEKL
ncbi:MAG: ABC transporter ATP-binding protein [Lachnospiraceae bacterium]|nr:ABC transporter ATP-binding protein [Lachnospiraceae bacterium]